MEQENYYFHLNMELISVAPSSLQFQKLFIKTLSSLAGSKTSQALALLFEEGSGHTENPELMSKFDRRYKRTTATNTSHKRHFPRVKSNKL